MAMDDTRSNQGQSDSDAVELRAPEGPLMVPANSQRNAGVWFSLIVPTYNESKNMEILVQQVTQLLDAQLGKTYEIIVVDDNSPDGTADTVAELASRYAQLHIVRRTKERGLATAVIRGWQQAAGQILGVMDGDLQHPTSVLRMLLQKIEDGADLCVASRYTETGSVGDWNIARRVLSKGAGILGLLLVPEAVCKVSDPMSGFFVLKRSVVAKRALKPKGYKILLEVLARGNTGRVAEVPFEFALRQHGETKVTWKQYVEYLAQLLELRLYLWSRVFADRS